MNEFSVILAAAGKSRRFRTPPGVTSAKKVFADLAGEPVWVHAAKKFHESQLVDQLLIVLSPEDVDWFEAEYAALIEEFGLNIVAGGAERADSVFNGLTQIQTRFVAIHDAARACITAVEIENCLTTAASCHAAILAEPCHSTVKRAPQQTIEATIPRQDLWLAQTPQAFETELLRNAYQSHPNPSSATDDASLVEALGHAVQVVPGLATNLKITNQHDLDLARAILSMQRNVQL